MADLFDSGTTAYEARRKAVAVGRDPLNWGFAITIDPAIVGANVGYGAAGRCQFVRLKTGAIISKVGLYVNAASGNISVAAYANTGVGRAAAPGTLLSTSGSVACPAAGYAEVALGSPVRVEPGDWLALSIDNTTATVGGVGNLGGLSNLMAGEIAYQDTSAFPCPTTPAIVGYGGRSVLLIGIP